MPSSPTTRASGATGVSAAAVKATFSEAMNAATISSSTFVLRDPSNALVTSTVSYDGSTDAATLTPAQALAPSTVYTATISGAGAGVKDVSGNAMTSNFV